MVAQGIKQLKNSLTYFMKKLDKFWLITIILILSVGGYLAAPKDTKKAFARNTEAPTTSVHLGSEWVVDGNLVYYSETLELVSVSSSGISGEFLVTARRKEDHDNSRTFIIHVANGNREITWYGVSASALNMQAKIIEKLESK